MSGRELGGRNVYGETFIRMLDRLRHDVPTRLVHRARYSLLDALGCGVFGSVQTWGRIMSEEIQSDRSIGDCTVLGSCSTSAAPQAALCNGTAIHGFELDDLLPAALIHPGTVIVPAVLAAAETCHASGTTVLRAIVIGYEAMARLSIALGMDASHRGFHKTSVVGPVAAAIAASSVYGSRIEQTTAAVGLACSTASGIKAFATSSGGGMVKRMHPGRAAEAGVRMASLARRGFSGPANAIDGQYGLLAAYGGDAAVPLRLTEGLGDEWATDGHWIKVYPICGWIQGVVQLVTALRGDEPVPLDDVSRVVVGTSAFAVKHNAKTVPADTMDAQYSIPYCVAVALEGDAADPAEYREPAIQDRRRHEFAAQVELRVDPESDAVYPARFGSRVELHLKNGETRTAATLDAHGTAADPCTDAEVEEKFRRLVTCSKSGIDAGPVIQAVRTLANVSDIRLFTRLLREPV